MNRWLKRFVVVVAIAVAVAGLAYAAHEMQRRRARGPVVAESDGAEWILAGDQRVVIGLDPLHDRVKGTYQVIAVDSATNQRVEIEKGTGLFVATASDPNWIYWSVNSGDKKRIGIYVMPLRGGPTRKVSDLLAISIGAGAGQVYFAIGTDGDDIWTGPPGGGPTRKVAQQPEERPPSLIEPSGGGKERLSRHHVVVSDTHAIWLTQYQVKSGEVPQPFRWIERVAHGQSIVEKPLTPCHWPLWLLPAEPGLYVGCEESASENTMNSVTRVHLLPKNGGSPTVIATLPRASEIQSHGRWFYFSGCGRGGESICRIPSSGGSEETVIANAGSPFALGAGRIWYTHVDGVASLPLHE